MKSFARVTKLSNVGGRADYISDPKRQESIVAASAPIDWKPYQEFEMANQKSDRRNNEGREVIVALPNEWAALSRDELSRRAEKLAVTAAGKSTDMQWAVHWNKAHTNLHIHVIFSERQKEKNPGKWDRDIYLTDDGKVARRKADRARNEDGSFKPPIHRKGEDKGGFTAKDPKYVSRAWVPAMKQQLRQEFAALGVVMEKPKLLHEFHEGKGKEASLIRQKNQVIRENNNRLEALASRGMDAVKYSKTLTGLLKQGKIPVLHLDESNRLRVTHFVTPSKAVALMENTKGQIQPMQQPTQAAAIRDPKQPEKAAPVEPLQKPQKAAPAALAEEREFRAAPDLKPSQKLRAAFDDLKKAQDRCISAQYDLSKANGLPFWNRQKKAKKEAASRELYAARQECQDAFDRVVSFGVSTYHDGVQLSGSNLDLDDMKALSRSVEWKVNDLEREEAHAAKPSLSENLIEAVKRYREKQKEMAPAVEAQMKERAKNQSKGHDR